MIYPQLTFSHLLHLTAHHWRLAVDRHLKDLGMSQATWVAVAAIAGNDTPMSQTDLASQLGVETATVVPLINRLLAQNLVARTADPGDRRKKMLSVTTEGIALYQKVRIVADELREDILSILTPEEEARTRDALERLLQEVQRK